MTLASLPGGSCFALQSISVWAIQYEFDLNTPQVLQSHTPVLNSGFDFTSSMVLGKLLTLPKLQFSHGKVELVIAWGDTVNI